MKNLFKKTLGRILAWRLRLNRNSDLVSGTLDIDPDLLVAKISSFQFKYMDKLELGHDENEKYRNSCLAFVRLQNISTRTKREWTPSERLYQYSSQDQLIRHQRQRSLDQ